MKFKAQIDIDETDFEDEEGWIAWKDSSKNHLDEDNYVTGYYVETCGGTPYIVGKLVDVDEQYTVLDYWYPVIKETVEVVKEGDAEVETRP